jgi:uncharacterized spore protein YtfJ
MIDTKTDFFSLAGKRDEQLSSVIEKIYSAAQPGAVYSEPVKSGNYTVIMASEVAVGGGFGTGSGIGPQGKKAAEESPQSSQISGGSGIGGGGGSSGRPVAVIVIGPDGVTVKPVFDITKIALAGITAWGTMLLLLRKMRRGNKR